MNKTIFQTLKLKLFLKVDIILLSILTVVVSVFQLLRVNQFNIVTGDSQKVILPLPYDDSALYLLKLKQVLTGQLNFRDETLGSGTSSYQSGSSLIFHFWGLIGRFFQLDLYQTYLCIVFFSTALLYITVHAVTRKFLKNRGMSHIFTFVSYVSIFNDNLARPSPTQLSLWIFFASVAATLDFTQKPSFFNAIKLNSAAIFLILSNPIYSAVSTSLLLFILYHKEEIKKQILLLSPYLFFISLWIVWFVSVDESEASRDQVERFGIFNSRLPGAFGLSAPIFLILIAVTIILKKRFSVQLRNILFLNFSCILALNSQIVTNKVFEIQSHLRYICLFTIFISLVTVASDNYLAKRILIPILFAVCVLGSIEQIRMLVYAPKVQNYSRLIAAIDLVRDPKFNGKTFLIKENTLEFYEYSWVAINSNIKFYWYPEAVYSGITNAELNSRLACTFERQLSLDEFLKLEPFLKGRGKVNEIQFLGKWNSLLKSIGINEISTGLSYNLRVQDYLSFSSIYDDCALMKYPYKLDYFLKFSLQKFGRTLEFESK